MIFNFVTLSLALSPDRLFFVFLFIDCRTRDYFYCAVCQKLGRGGRNLNELVEAENIKDQALHEEREREEEERRVEEEEKEKIKEAMRLIEEASRPAVVESESSERKMEKEKEEEQQLPQSPTGSPPTTNVVRVDLSNADNTTSEVL